MISQYSAASNGDKKVTECKGAFVGLSAVPGGGDGGINLLLFLCREGNFTGDGRIEGVRYLELVEPDRFELIVWPGNLRRLTALHISCDRITP